jgi:hypothetical protein
LNQFDFISGERLPRFLLERRECERLRQHAGRFEFTVGPALDRPPDDQSGGCYQRRKRNQGASAAPQKRLGRRRSWERFDLIERPFHDGEPYDDFDLVFAVFLDAGDYAGGAGARAP